MVRARPVVQAEGASVAAVAVRVDLDILLVGPPRVGKLPLERVVEAGTRRDSAEFPPGVYPQRLRGNAPDSAWEVAPEAVQLLDEGEGAPDHRRRAVADVPPAAAASPHFDPLPGE